MCNQNQAIEILRAVYEKSKPVYGAALCDAYLYGSYARGDSTNESDIDILLTVRDSHSFISAQRKKWLKSQVI